MAELGLLLLVINLGIVCGAGMYEQRVVLPLWFPKTSSTSAGIRVNHAMILDTDPGMKFWAFAATVPLTLLTLLNLWTSFQAPLYAPSPAAALTSRWSAVLYWRAAACVALLERTGTFCFFIPTMLHIMRRVDRKADAPSPVLGTAATGTSSASAPRAVPRRSSQPTRQVTSDDTPAPDPDRADNDDLHYSRVALKWLRLNYVRGALSWMAWLCALKAYGSMNVDIWSE